MNLESRIGAYLWRVTPIYYDDPRVTHLAELAREHAEAEVQKFAIELANQFPTNKPLMDALTIMLIKRYEGGKND